MTGSRWETRAGHTCGPEGAGYETCEACAWEAEEQARPREDEAFEIAARCAGGGHDIAEGERRCYCGVHDLDRDEQDRLAAEADAQQAVEAEAYAHYQADAGAPW